MLDGAVAVRARRYRDIRTRAPRARVGYRTRRMTASLPAQRRAVFLGAAAAAVAAECAVVASRAFAVLRRFSGARGDLPDRLRA